jgi:alpha-glucosidase
MFRGRRVSLALALAAALAASCGSSGPKGPVVSTAPTGDGWHRRVVFYQVMVRSFQDSDGDGIGDLQGLIDRLDYLAELGVGALWLMPVYPSPLADEGYDVADYRGIHPDYGDLDTFRRLLDEAHLRNLKVMMDLVVNHTSEQHAWFQESRQSAGNAKADWYVWADDASATCHETNGIFGSERWTLDAPRGQYYFHEFLPAQPDLNFRNPDVVAEVRDMMAWWMEMGVDGFRADVPYQYVESWPDCWYQPETFAIHQLMRQTMDGYPQRASVAEIQGKADQVLPYLGDGSDAFHMVFYFDAMYGLWNAGGEGDPTDLATAVQFGVDNTPAGGLLAVPLGNHDQFRTTRTITEDVAGLKIVATAQLTLPGAPFVYYGEEIGMLNGQDVFVDFRDESRSPMQWDGSKTGGFTTGTPWLAMADKVDTINVADEERDKGSLLRHYRGLIALRNATPALQDGAYEAVAGAPAGVLAFFRRHEAGDRLVVLHFGLDGDATMEVPLPAGWATALTDEVTGDAAGAVAGDVWSATLGPRTGLVLAPR